MKGLAIFLLCVVAAVQVQGRSTGVQVANNQRSLAALGENPWVVHLRLAVSTSGLLNSCIGAIIDETWVLTTATCVFDARFIWIRFGVVEVIRPELVTETSAVRLHEDWWSGSADNNIALVNINRVVETTANIAVIALPAANSQVSETGNYCAYGQENQNTPGEWLRCWDVSLVAENNYAVIVEGEGISATEFDTGAPLVSDNTLTGLLLQASESGRDQAVFLRTSAYVNWIVGMTGIGARADRDPVIVVE